MSEAEKKELKALCENARELDENGRMVVKIALEALLAKQELEEVANGKRYE